MNWKLKDILMIAVCAVLFGVIFLGATYAGGFLYGLLTPVGMPSLGYEPFYGLYFMAVAFAVYVIRKPGVGIVAEILAAIIETLMGNFFGPIIILSGFVQGAGFELIFEVY
jgi:energy-coupling factor transport system substrate-specific component